MKHPEIYGNQTSFTTTFTEPFIILYPLTSQLRFYLYSNTHQFRTAYGVAIRVHALLTSSLGTNDYSDLNAGYLTRESLPHQEVGWASLPIWMHGTRTLLVPAVNFPVGRAISQLLHRTYCTPLSS